MFRPGPTLLCRWKPTQEPPVDGCERSGLRRRNEQWTEARAQAFRYAMALVVMEHAVVHFCRGASTY
jgi:hypothetical protein